MSEANNIVIWGASGYTGKLISESLHKLGIPFTAAGRTEAKLRSALEVAAARAGAETIDAQVATAIHQEESLIELFSGAKVVVNVTGPFSQLGETVVKSALAAGCHYLDTTGEQDFMLAMKNKYGQLFADQGLLLSPACSYMWALGALAAEVALENDAIDSIELSYISAQGAPSVASSQSFMRMLAAPHFYLENNELKPWELGRTFDVTIPGYAKVFKASSWGGAAEPCWYQEDNRVRSCKVYQCAEDNNLMELIIDGVKQVIEGSGGDAEVREALAIESAGAIVQEEPDKENPLLHRGVVHCNANGNIARSSCTISFHSPYVITGELIATACRHLLKDEPKVVGFASAAVAIGHREIINFLADQDYLVVNTAG